MEELLAQVKAELEVLNQDEINFLGSGYHNRGLDCVVERWYAPDRLKESSALAKAAGFIQDFKELLYDVYEKAELD